MKLAQISQLLATHGQEHCLVIATPRSVSDTETWLRENIANAEIKILKLSGLELKARIGNIFLEVRPVEGGFDVLVDTNPRKPARWIDGTRCPEAEDERCETCVCKTAIEALAHLKSRVAMILKPMIARG